MKRMLNQCAAIGSLLVAFTTPGMAATPATQPSSSGLTSLRLEELMNMEVTSVSKSEQKISDAPASISVILPDDFSRSGLNSIPEALRLVPGLDVEQINANR